MRRAVEGSVDLSTVVAILFQDVPQEHQLDLQAVFIKKSSGSVYRNGEMMMGLGIQIEIGVSGLAVHFVSQRVIRSSVNIWVMMGLGVEAEIGVCGLAVHFVSQRAIRSSVNIHVQEWEVAFTFGFHDELNGLMDAV
jgi:hypothetical protein